MRGQYAPNACPRKSWGGGKLARATAYYQPLPVSAEILVLIRRIDELQLQYLFAGVRMLRDVLQREALEQDSAMWPPAATLSGA